MSTEPLILACSPRPGGNTDTAAGLLAAALLEAGHAPRLVHLRDWRINACRGCQACAATKAYLCMLRDSDQSEELFEMLMSAPLALICSPIYFYHLPAHFKAWIDRAQRYWAMSQAGEPRISALPGRHALALLIAGRPKGDKLFEGSLLTLSYFLKAFRMELGPNLLLRGLDQPGALGADLEAQAQVVELAKTAVGLLP